MFIENKTKPDQYREPPQFSRKEYNSPFLSKIGLYAVIGLAALIMIGIGVIYIFFIKPEENQPVVSEPVASTTPVIGLPGDYGNGDGSDIDIDMLNADIKAEYLTFGYFYKRPVVDFEADNEDYGLPINVKVDVSNYYDISRKINLDPYLDHINRYGFAVIDNQFAGEAKDFYSAYRLLGRKEIPLVITSDFLLYYFQNTLKDVFKDIEKTSFFENIWNINKRMYTIALNRYKMRLAAVGTANDPVLEAMRLEMAYYAVALRLLQPIEAQINKKPNLTDNSKFEVKEAESYNFVMPSTLEDDVFKEVDLIRGGELTKKSPVMLYERNYADFTVPRHYQENAKLNNFYLTLKWLNSNFPLYERQESCPDCVLDRDDWSINLAAACFITKDMSENQDIKNQWAIIYKFVSFFTGLRQDLTYLHYREALTDVFGKDYKIEDIFAADNVNRDADMKKLQERIARFTFLDMEGGINRHDEKNKRYLGMRMLQESYWPNDYIFNHLTGEGILSQASNKIKPPFTACHTRNRTMFYRCRGLSLDVVNLIHPDPGLIDSDYFRVNTAYEFYPERIKSLKSEIDRFDINAWNNNAYWSTLDIAKRLLKYDSDYVPVFMKNNDWHNQKDINTVLGGWVNLHLPADKLAGYHEVEEGLGSYSQESLYDYVEPNIGFIAELMAKNDMLSEMMNVLRVTKKTNAASVELKEINSRFAQILDIARKELSGEDWDIDDRRFITEFVGQNIVENAGEKDIILNPRAINEMTESINGVKFVVLVYKIGEKNIMAVGPVFNYSEK
ncbi:hypothetical protein A2303_02960 [Candidatus Falkowbacteria bacterium RIFOXYB2_FULL_47_14]|uniref:DUF3160 domain-containing protein n=1 Tax=Candidatus Falkowbacteria bacterium RIFOXYA2_FULL_47_19 TaxID=1797994 RepID=A0A1F5SLP3_9BACT|nr:MAG: hypothetical protein A2227_02035 [Candidatus Falkowbacteria bacterium RIFOXYA2_FULL_47_19]OGF36275.1 MAG: hypothetical protein A2468_07705 [Candidatus Falkowbacteria bacterium RIFOXYC2_FULL_46_15]OGF43079.1 MAG: hypothetical protein A2303_02960 [Candidatus Falkowbacteria bacterium RIFOXYB2_FULL_47_14]